MLVSLYVSAQRSRRPLPLVPLFGPLEHQAILNLEPFERVEAVIRETRSRCSESVQAKAHVAAQQALQEELETSAAATAADVSAERLRKLDDALSDRSARLLQDNVRLRAELKVHSEVLAPSPHPAALHCTLGQCCTS